MKTVTSAFRAAQLRNHKRVRTLEYKRRRWDGSAWAWETSWTLIPARAISNISPVNWALDTDILNEFKVSNVTIVFDNAWGEWNPGNRSGYLGRDEATKVDFEPYWTKFRVRKGFVLDDGTEELVTVFTGVIANDPVYDAENKTAQITLYGLEATLENTSAESIATHITNEDAGDGDDVEKVFETVHPGVGRVTKVTVNAVEQIPDADYKVSQTNDDTLPAKVTFEIAPPSGHEVLLDYFYWPQDLEFDEVIALLLDQADVPSVNREVQKIVFENDVLNTLTYSSQAEFEGENLTAVDTARVSGSIFIDWDNAQNVTDQDWTESDAGWTYTKSSGAVYTLGSNGSSIVMSHDGWNLGSHWGRARRNYGKPWGVLEFEAYRNMTFGGTENFDIYLGQNADGSGTNRRIRLNLHNARIYVGSDDIGDAHGIGVTGVATWTKYRVVIYEGKLFVYRNDVLRATVTDAANIPPNATYFVFTTALTISSVLASDPSFQIRNIKTAPANGTGTFRTNSIDAGAPITAWGALDKIQFLGGVSTSVKYYTRTSVDDSVWSDWEQVTGVSPVSPLRRYLQMKAEFAYPSNSPYNSGGDPYIESITLRYASSVTGIVLPNFTGQNAYAAIQSLAAFANYEFGFTPDEVFFFRPKSTGSSQMTLTGKDYVLSLPSWSPGYDRTYGIVRATYGDVVRTREDATGGRTDAGVRFGERTFDFSADSNIQIAATADVATGIAIGLLAYFAKSRRRFQVQTVALPQIDLSDVVTLTLENSVPTPSGYWGEPGAYWNKPGMHYWGAAQQPAVAVPCKVISAQYGTEEQRDEFLLEEIV